MSKHPIVHFEFSSVDKDKMKAFYGTIFGWEFQDWPEMDYVTFSTGEGDVGGGFNPVTDEFPAGSVVNYVNSDDIQATIKAVTENGGQVAADVMEVPGVGQIAIVFDPSKNLLGLIQPAEEMDQE